MIDDIIKDAQAYMPDLNVERVRRAYEFARDAHEGQFRKDGTPYINHPLRAAWILTDLRVDEDTLIACILHDVPEDTDRTLDDVEKKFGKQVRFLVEGITKLSKVHYRNDMVERQVDSLKKLFIHTAEDPRVILIKLADRLHNMRTIEAIPKEEKRRRIAKETLEIFVPVANLIGIWELKSQLEDHCFRVLQPNEYEQIDQLVQGSSFKKEDFLRKSTQEMEQLLRQHGIPFYFVEGRKKSYYSIYRKMVFGEKSFSELYDLVGLRIVLENVTDCYQTLGIIHQNFCPKVGRLKDYIAIPKSNGYQGIHTTVFGPDGVVMELQIRTYDMHLENEYGIAAHYFYREAQKQTESSTREQRKRYNWMQDILNMQKDIKNNKDFMRKLKLDVFKDRIFVFTPKGDVIDLPKGASLLDFAYHVHSEVGMLAEYGRVNGKEKPLFYQLQSGDVVHVHISESSEGPQVEWLQHIQTNLARTRIREYLKERDRTSLIQQAEHALEEKLRLFGVGCTVSDKQKLSLMNQFAVDDWESLLLEVGQGEVATQDVLLHLYSESELFGEEYESHSRKSPLGLQARKVHRVGLAMSLEDRMGLLAKISNVMARFHINMVRVNTEKDTTNGIVHMKLEIEISDLEGYERTISSLSRMPGVISITRYHSEAKAPQDSVDSHKAPAQSQPL